MNFSFDLVYAISAPYRLSSELKLRLFANFNDRLKHTTYDRQKQKLLRRFGNSNDRLKHTTYDRQKQKNFYADSETLTIA